MRETERETERNKASVPRSCLDINTRLCRRLKLKEEASNKKTNGILTERFSNCRERERKRERERERERRLLK